MASLFSAVIILAAAQVVPTPTDPLAPARSGQLQCYSPDVSRKVCRALAGYSWGANGAIQNSAEVLILPNPPVVMKTASPVQVRSGAVCGPLRAEDIEAATILVAGRPAPPQVTQQVRSQLLSALSGRSPQEVCTTYVADGSRYKSKVTINGVGQPAASETVIWVRPNEGYAVGP